MARSHFETCELDDGREVEVEFTITPGSPPSGPTYDCGGHPGDPEEIEIVAVNCGGEAIRISVSEEDRIIHHIGENFEFDDGPDPDDARDRMIDDRLMEQGR